MLNVDRVLFTTDFSEASNRAIPHAQEIAARFNAELIIGHVRIAISPLEADFLDEGSYARYAEEGLKKFSSRITGQEFRTVERTSISAATGILEMIQSEKIDLVVMATHGRTGLGHFVMGSVAEKVVRHAEVPVLTVALQKEDYRDNPQYRSILVGFDYSDYSKTAVTGGYEIARAYDAKLKILNVIEQSVRPGYYATWRESALKEVPNSLAEIRETVSSLLGRNGSGDVEIEVGIGNGDGRVAREINEFARQHEIDLIILGTHGLAGFEHLLLGSTTERVIRSAPCPVLTFHRKNDA